MSVANQIVETLLESGHVVQACASCEQETGQRTPNASHGYCKRHLIQMWQANAKQMPQMAEQARMRVAQIQQRPESDFPPDLSQQRQGAAAPARM